MLFWVNTYEKEGTEAGLGRGRSQGMTQFYSKAFTSLTRRSSEAERGPHSCPGWGVMVFTSLGGPDFGGEEQERAHGFRCSNSFETRQVVGGADSEGPCASSWSRKFFSPGRDLGAVQRPLPGQYWWASHLRPRAVSPSVSPVLAYLRFKGAFPNPFLQTPGK